MFTSLLLASDKSTYLPTCLLLASDFYLPTYVSFIGLGPRTILPTYLPCSFTLSCKSVTDCDGCVVTERLEIIYVYSASVHSNDDSTLQLV